MIHEPKYLVTWTYTLFPCGARTMHVVSQYNKLKAYNISGQGSFLSCIDIPLNSIAHKQRDEALISFSLKIDFARFFPVLFKCEKGLNILRCAVSKKWGADVSTALAFYRSYIRSILDYGCILYK